MIQIRLGKAFRVLLGLVVLSMISVACGTGESTDTEPTDTQPTSTTAPTSTAVPTTEGPTGPQGTFRYAYYNAPGTFDPHKETTSFANVPLFVTYDRLVHLAPDGSLLPGLAESWEFSDDVKTLTLHIREGVVFHDGTTLDANAVKANLDRARTLEDSAVLSDLAQVEDVVVVDDYTVELLLSVGSVVVPATLADRAGAMVCPSAFDDPNLTTNPCGAGMYRLDEPYVPGSSISFLAFEDYWQSEAIGAAAFEITFLTDPTARLNALRTGEVDASHIEADQIPDAEGAGLQVAKGEDFGYGLIYLNVERIPALQDERVRLAMNLAIDREGIVEGLLFGQGVPTSQPFPEGYFAHNPDVQPFPFDVERARELMAEAGYADGFDIELSTIPSALRERTTDAVAAMFGEIGIRATPTVVEAAVLGGELLREKTRDASVLGWGGRNDPSITFALMYTGEGFYNPGGLSYPEFEELHLQALAETDPEERAAILREMSAFTIEHPMAIIAIFSPFAANAASPNVTGLNHYLTGKVEFRGVGVTP